MSEYYFLDAREDQHGPFAITELPARGVTRRTLVWTEGMEDWQEAGSVPELRSLFEALPGGSAPAQVAPPQSQDVPEMVAEAPALQANPPSSYLAAAVFSTLCCNPLLGIIAIIFSLQSIWFSREGMDYDARRASIRSKSCSYTAIFLGLAIAAVAILLAAFGFAGGLSDMVYELGFL